jgi:hypothetical protein
MSWFYIGLGTAAAVGGMLGFYVSLTYSCCGSSAADLPFLGLLKWVWFWTFLGSWFGAWTWSLVSAPILGIRALLRRSI